ncbi:MAG: 16S rRNA (uracil(1498)-N(3))-methyltransferase [Chloroflexi bacterium]|nr:16S rRNA (uracil(1498)-N(3))-methyltransferase [Chloroflexota bacterium]
MHRFFVSPDCIDGQDVTLPDNVARQLARVLRFKSGDSIIVLDDSGMEYVVTLTAVDSNTAQGVVSDKRVSDGEPDVRLVLYQGMLKSDRFEFVLQKGTELGVSAFVPVSCARSVAKGDSANRSVRWRKIITEAAEQSGRGRIPILEKPSEFFNACDAHEGPGLIPWEEEADAGLRSVLERWKASDIGISSVSIFIGPEGGFTREEVEYARSKGIVAVSLGKRILRAETAGIATAAAILYEIGELGA